jgi:hypothetical protein
MWLVVDESYRSEAKLYLVAGLMLTAVQADPAREAAIASLPPGRVPFEDPFHYRKESERYRAEFLRRTVRNLSLAPFSVIRTNVAARQQESAREACMSALFRSTAGSAVLHVIYDLRSGPGQEAIDHQLVSNGIGAGSLPRDVECHCLRPSQEPLIWIADAVAGAVGDFHGKGEPRPYGLISRRLSAMSV